MTYEYAVVIRRQKASEPAVWQLWIGAGCVRESASFLAVMDWAGARGFEAFAAGNFDELGVPEVLMKRAIALAPPPPMPATTGRAGDELAGTGAAGARGATGATGARSRPRASGRKPAGRTD